LSDPEDRDPTVRELLVSLHAKLDKLAGLPQTVQDLINKWVDLNQTLLELKPMVEGHAAELRVHDRTLRELGPKLDALTPKVEELGILVPKAIANIELATREIRANKEAGDAVDAELRDSLTDLEAAAGERRSAAP
jgi:hypothetical protein